MDMNTESDPFTRMSLQNCSGELLFFILWEHGRHKEKEILADIGRNFDILECFDILWSPNLATSNFCRLSDLGLRLERRHIKECGIGRFLLITVWDNNPMYELVETSFGFEWTNTNILELTKRHRMGSDQNNVSAVYSSINQEETNRILTLVIGKHAADYIAAVKTPWDGSFVKMDRDIPGANGWNSLEEVFYVLNNTIDYALLRDFETLPFDLVAVERGISILTNDREQLICILNPSYSSSGGRIRINIGGSPVPWEIHYVGDNYYCSQWEQDMLKKKVVGAGNLHVLNNEHHFYSLVYHALIHRETIPKDYYVKAEQLLDSLLPTEVIEKGRATFPGAFDYYFDLLTDYLKREHYEFCRPQKGGYNQIVTHLSHIAERLEKKFRLSQTKPIHLTRYGSQISLNNPENCGTYYQSLLNGKKIFIKQGGHPGWCKREFDLSSQLTRIDKDNFFETLFYSEFESDRCVASEFLVGETLESKLKSTGFSAAERENVIVQLKRVAESLLETGILHCDAGADNFVVTKEGTLKLIDFGQAVDSKQSWECSSMKRDSWFFRQICSKCKERFHCCDVFMLQLMLERIGCQESYRQTYGDVESFLREHPKIVAVRCKYSPRRILHAAWTRLKNSYVAFVCRERRYHQ